MENENQNIETTPIDQTQNILGNNIINSQENITQSPIDQTQGIGDNNINPQENTSSSIDMEPLPGLSDEPVEPILNNPPISNNEKPNNKNIRVPLIIGISALLLVGLVIAGIFIIPNLMFSGKKALENEITTVFDMAEDILKEKEKYILDYDLDKETLGFEGILTIDSDYKDETYDYTKLKNYKLTYDGVLDKKSNIASGTVRLVNGTNNIVSVDGYGEGKYFYFSLGDIFNKIILYENYQEIKDLDLDKVNDTQSMIKLLDKTESIIKSSIKEENITVTKENKFRKVTYKCKTKELMKEILNGYQNDKEIMEILSKTYNISEDQLKEFIDYRLKFINDDEEVSITLYLQGFKNEFKKTEITVSGKIFLIEKENNTYNFTVTENQEIIASGDFNKNATLFNLDIKDGISLKAKEEGNDVTLNIEYKDEYEEYTANVVMTNIVENDIQTNTTTVNVLYTADENTIKLTINNDIKLEKNKEVKKSIDTTNAVDYETLTNEDINLLSTNLYNKLSVLLNEIMPNQESLGDNNYSGMYYNYAY